MSYQITTEIRIDASPSSVWEVLTDFSRYPEWNPFILTVLGVVKKGASVRYRFAFPPGVRIWATAHVLEFRQQKELRWAAHFLSPALFNGEHYFAVDRITENSVTFRHGETFTGILVPLALIPLHIYGQHVYRSLNSALKERVESLVSFGKVPD